MDRRRYPRRTVDRPAKVFMPQGGSLPCRISDVSRGGAKLTFGWKGWLPRAFDIQDAFTGVRRTAQIIWRGVHGIGVQFTRIKPAAYRRIGFGRRQR
ncbi:MAG: PilZ domain-containing protein [Limisphaerales bacterium]